MKNEDISIVIPPSNPVIIGKIGKTYGIYGWVKITSFTEKIDSIFHYHPWFVYYNLQWKLLQLESWKLINKNYIAKIIDYTDRESAVLLTKLDLIVDRSTFPVLFNEQYYCQDIIGCQVITVENDKLGYVFSIIDAIAHDVLVVNTDNNNFDKIEKYLIPFIQSKIVKNVNLVEKIIIVDWYI